MAITITQSPTFPNIANNDIIFIVSSSQVAQPQFQFVADISDENGTLIQRVKQQPNPSGYGVFNFKNIIKNQFDNDYVVSFQEWYATPFINVPIPNQKYIASANNGGAVKQFDVSFGEEYAVSTTATSSLYNGAGALGEPIVSASNNNQWYLNGTLDINDRYPIWSSGWNFTNPSYDRYVVNAGAVEGMPYNIFRGEGKWQPIHTYGAGADYVNGLGKTEFDAKYPPNNLYQFNVGLTDYDNTTANKPRKVFWDDIGTISYLNGTDVSSQWQIDNPTGSYFPEAQLVEDGRIIWYRSDGTSNTTTIPMNRDTTTSAGTYGNYITEGRFSQSLDVSMIHTPMFPSNFLKSTTSMRTPAEHPSSYTTGYKIEVQGFRAGNKVGWSQNYISGSFRSGFDNPEFGSTGYGVPLIIMDSVAGAIGSYPASTAKCWFRGASGGDCVVSFQTADVLYPSIDYPIASPAQIVSDINTQLQASGSSVRAWLTPNYNFPSGSLIPAELESEEWAQWNVMVADTYSTYDNSTTLHVLTKSGELDAFGTALAGENSCLGIGTGNYDSFGSDNTNTYTSGSTIFYSTYDTRYFEVDWDGFDNNLYSDCEDCGYTHKQFMWKNKYGAFDYFTFTKAETITNDIERESYEQSFVDYSATSILPFNKSRRGTEQYYNKITQRHIIESDWMTKNEADNIKEMFFSTAVWELQKQNSWLITGYPANAPQVNEPTTQYVDVFSNQLNNPLPQAEVYTSSDTPPFQVEQIPIVITNAQLIEKTNPRTQKLYKVSAEFIYSNDLNARV